MWWLQRRIPGTQLLSSDAQHLRRVALKNDAQAKHDHVTRRRGWLFDTYTVERGSWRLAAHLKKINVVAPSTLFAVQHTCARTASSGNTPSAQLLSLRQGVEMFCEKAVALSSASKMMSHDVDETMRPKMGADWSRRALGTKDSPLKFFPFGRRRRVAPPKT